MINLSYDLHIHSCLSPCGSDEMLPSDIVGMAVVKGLDVIAVTDHNSCKNCPAVMTIAQNYGIIAIPGMEICTSEEVHAVCLFHSLQNAMSFDSYVHQKLPDIKNNPEIFGLQQIVDADDNIIAHEPLLLINAANISFTELYDTVTAHNGVMFPAHIDKNTNSLISNLGFIPPDSKFACAEIKNLQNSESLLDQHQYLQKCKIITNSDAHYLSHINEPVNFMKCEDKSPESVLHFLSSPL